MCSIRPNQQGNARVIRAPAAAASSLQPSAGLDHRGSARLFNSLPLDGTYERQTPFGRRGIGLVFVHLRVVIGQRSNPTNCESECSVSQGGSLSSIFPTDENAERRAFLRHTILLNVVLWLFIYAVLTVRAPLIEKVAVNELALRRMLTVTAGALYSYGLTYPLRFAPLTAFWQRILLGVALAVGGSVLHAFTHVGLYYELFPIPGAKLPDVSFSASEIALWSIFWLGYYLAAVATYLALLYSSEFRRNERSLSLMRAFADDAHLRTLRYQINPHFLFNTLNSLSALVLDRKTREAERMLQALADFYRRTLATDPHKEISLSDELDIQRLYLAIEEVRFADRLVVFLDVAPDVLNCSVPALLLQPLVENAVLHGVALRECLSVIEITAFRRGPELVITVRNERPSKPGAQAGLGVGLKNVEQRLSVHYGDRAKFRATPAGDFWLSEITIPVRE